MKKNTRQQILDTAKRLFNERGYNGVSLKDIADEIGISKGNLTYHFSKKEVIMESLIFDTPNTQPNFIASNLLELDKIFLDRQEAVQNNAYYFLYHSQLSDLSPRIAEAQTMVYRQVVHGFQQSFKTLQDKGLLRSEMFHHEYDRIIDQLHMASIYWTSFSSLQKTAGIPADYRTHAWSIMYHLLTEKGKNELENIIYL